MVGIKKTSFLRMRFSLKVSAVTHRLMCVFFEWHGQTIGPANLLRELHHEKEINRDCFD